MTCIVGLVERDKVWIGGDSSANGDSLTYQSRHPKVFMNAGFLIGYTTSFRMGQLLQHAFKPPAIEQDLHAYMVTSFVDAARATMKAGGYLSKDKEVEWGGTFLVGIRGELFEINSNFGVMSYQEGYVAIGSGYELATGAMFTSKERGYDRVKDGLKAAAHFSQTVSPPFTIMST